MTRAEFIQLCLSFAGVYEDYPFHDPNWTVMRHHGTTRSFALVYEREGKLWANLKCEPMQAEFWRKVYTQVQPGYHMNKTHWNTILLDGSLPEEVLEEMLRHSYDLTKPKSKAPKKKRPT
ncbi:MAG: MmcQ/YjbR family DNA-binding protein [Anaerotruncus sp.]|nr:MmcQ/YjbR family DNA-binding protein [Anaerotruncus sp.]